MTETQSIIICQLVVIFIVTDSYFSQSFFLQILCNQGEITSYSNIGTEWKIDSRNVDVKFGSKKMVANRLRLFINENIDK